MTTQEMIDEVRASLGNRTDITNERYVQWLNWALFDVCGQHRKRSANSRVFKCLERVATFPAIISSGTVTSATSSTMISSTFSEVDSNYYNNFIVEISDFDEDGAGTDTPDGLLDQKRVIVSYTPSTGSVTIAPDWDTTPTGTYTSFNLYQRMYGLNSTIISNLADTGVWGIQRLEDVENGTVLEMQAWTDIAKGDFTQLGTPTAFGHRGDYILFNITPDEERWFRLWYYTYPTQLTSSNLSGESNLPEYWHEIIVLGAVYRGFQKLMEPDRASQALVDYTNSLTNRIDSDEIENGYIAHSFKLRMS
jgi:hypothetical protein